MCGVVGYVGKRRAAPLLLAGLRRLEYRGYDSAGIATLGGGLCVMKRAGPVSALAGAAALPGKCGIGHTRWATHGAATEQNAHPHVWGRFAVVHNGIIENERELRAECMARGENFSSETDSEVVAHLLEFYYEGDLLSAVRKTVSRLAGAYALAILCTAEQDTIALARQKSPLAVGEREGELFAASDLSAIARRGTRLYLLGDGETAILRKDGVSFYGRGGEAIEKQPVVYDGERPPERGKYRHFTRKEIDEIPAVMAAARPKSSDVGAFREALLSAEHVQIAACGTARHAGLAAKIAFERLARVQTEVFVASEYRYLDPIVPPNTLFLAVSQSGETADTVAAAACARERGAKVAAVVNSPHSALAETADFTIPVHAGKEVSVAATKSFNAQLMTLYSLAASLAEGRGLRGYGDALAELPRLAEEAVRAGERVQSWVPYFLGAGSAYFIGRGADGVTALEGSLKLKEITYLPGEGYPAGELKHGALALVDGSTPVVALITSRRLAEKTMNAVHETASRGAKVFVVTSLPAYACCEKAAASVLIPDCGEIFSPALSVIPLQLLAYYVSIARGIDPDRPRNLAKSVTVE